jgi:hypothetical protein
MDKAKSLIGTMHRLWGNKHPESRGLSEDLFADLQRDLVMTKEPH